MLLGVQAYTLNENLVAKIGKLNINKATMETYFQKTFFSLNLNSLLLSESDMPKINLSFKNPKNSNDLKKQNKESIASEANNKLHSLYKNIFNIKSTLNKGSEYKHYFNKEDFKDFKILLGEKLQKKTYLPLCIQEDFEIKELNSECVLGKKVFYFSKKKNIICAIDNYILKLKKANFIKNYLTVLTNLYLANAEESSKSEHIPEKISLLLNQIEPIFKIELENYIPEILNTENFLVEKVENCNCDLLRDFDCDENLKTEASNTNIFKKNLIDKNKIYESCIKYLNLISQPAAESNNEKYNDKITNKNTDKNTNFINNPLENLKPNNFEVFKNSANTCLIGEKLWKTILSEKAEGFKIRFHLEKNLLSISELVSEKNLNYDLIASKDINVNHNKEIGADANNVIKEKDEDSFKANENAGFGFLVISFIAVVLILVVYMGYLVIKNMLAAYFPYKKARNDEHYDDPSEVGLKVKAKTGRSKELDSIY
jgi:hypothetical protein